MKEKEIQLLKGNGNWTDKTSDAMSGVIFKTWNREYRIRIQRYVRIFSTLILWRLNLMSFHVEDSEQLGLDQSQTVPWLLQNGWLLTLDAALYNWWTPDPCCRAESVTCPTTTYRLFSLITVTCFTMWNKDKGRQGKQTFQFLRLSVTGTDLPKPALSFTEAVPLDLLLSSCYCLNEEVVSKHIL